MKKSWTSEKPNDMTSSQKKFADYLSKNGYEVTGYKYNRSEIEFKIEKDNKVLQFKVPNNSDYKYLVIYFEDCWKTCSKKVNENMNRESKISNILEGLHTNEGGITFVPMFGCKLLYNMGDLKKDTLFYCESVDKTHKTVTLIKQKDKSYKIIVPTSFAENFFANVSGLTERKTYTLKVDIAYTPVESARDMEWPEKFITKYTKNKWGNDWIVFPKGTKFTFIGQSQSGDEFEVEGQYVPISDVEFLNNGEFEDYLDIFKLPL